MAEQYEKLECIGRGSFGEVYKGRDIATGNIVALKLVDLEKTDEEIDIIQREIKVMSQIANPHVVQYYSSMMKESMLCIVMEFMSGGSLKDLIDSVGPLPEEAVATVMKSLCKGLDYVHKENKLHRDIKAANILLTDRGDVKLADFGVAGQMTSTVRERNTFVGSPFWMAPEVIQESLYNEKADIWSLGITGLELANGMPPYATEHPYAALFLIPKNEPPRVEGSQFSKSFKDFIAMCLRKNPAERAGAEHLLQHPFLKKARTSSLREVLRQKNKVDGREGVVVAEGDSLKGSLGGTFREHSDNSNTAAKNPQSTISSWEFDFGSVNSQTDSKEIVRNVGKEETQNGDSTNGDSASGDGAHGDTMCKLVEASETARLDQPDIGGRNSLELGAAPQSEVLSELILPVISQIRADEDTSGGRNSSLMNSLGSLEVAFVDAESAKQGVSSLLLESLFREAMRSESAEVRSLLKKTLLHGKENGT